MPAKLIVVSGGSGSGKSTILKEILKRKPEYVFSISSTTRAPRPHETNGTEYFFLSHEEFNRRVEAGEFLEWAEVHGEFYGTEKRVIEEELKAGNSVLLDLDVYGGAAVKRLFPEAVLIFIKPPDINSLRERLEKRGTDSSAQIEKRLSRYPFEEEQGRTYTFQIINDDLEMAIQEVTEIIERAIG